MDVIIRVLAVTLLYFTFLWDTATGHPLRTHCHIHRYKSIPPSTMSQVKELQILYELKDREPLCHHHGLQLKKFPNCDLKGNERLMLTQYRVSLAVKVLENTTTRTSLVNQTLEYFSILQTDLSKCEMVKSPTVELCLHHLTKYTEKASAECLQDSVLLHLVWILFEDLGSVTCGKSCEKGPQRLSPQLHPTRPVPKRHKGEHPKYHLKAKSSAQ